MRRPFDTAIVIPGRKRSERVRNGENESCGIMVRPHPEEPQSGVSKDGNNTVLFSILRDAAKKAAPQDEVSLLFDGEISQLGARRAKQRIACPAPFAKIFPLPFEANHLLISRHPSPTRQGRFAIVKNVGQGMRWTRHVKDE
jgi:hypothetical protein